MRRILIVKLADLGDVLICEPAIRSLRVSYPDAEIDVLLPPTSSGILDLIGHESKAIPFPKHIFDSPIGFASPSSVSVASSLAKQLRRNSYDAVVILHHLTTAFGAAKFRALHLASGASIVAGLDNGRGSFLTHRVLDTGFGKRHEAEYMLAVAQTIGGASTDPRPSVSHSGASPPVPLPRRYVAMFPATGPYSSARTWPAERFGELARRLRQSDWPVVIVGATDASNAANVIRTEVPDVIDLAGRTTINELAAVVDGASAVIGGDSFIGHLGAALDTPVISIFGPSNVDAWKPYGSVIWDETLEPASRSIVVNHQLPCEPCIYTGYSLGRPKGCPSRTCLTMVTVEMVIAGALQALEAS